MFLPALLWEKGGPSHALAQQQSSENRFLRGLVSSKGKDWGWDLRAVPATKSSTGMRRMICLLKTFANTSKSTTQLCVRKGSCHRQTSSELRDVISPFQLRTEEEAVQGCRRKGLKKKSLFFFLFVTPHLLKYPPFPCIFTTRSK